MTDGSITVSELNIKMVISESVWHRSINGVQLGIARENKGLTQAKFAELCQWSQQYQSQIEAPGVHEVGVSIAERIEKILLS